MLKYRCIGLIASLGAIVAISGCGSSSNNNVAQARVRVLNAALGTTGGQPVDVLVNGQRQFSNVGFGATSSRIQVASGNAIPITIQQAGTGVTIGTGTVNLTQGVDETILVTGVPGGSGGLQFQAIVLPPEDLTATPISTQSRVFFVNAGTNTTAGNSTATFTLMASGATVLTVGPLAFGEMSAAQLPQAGTYTISATVNGQTVSTTTTLDGGKTYTVAVTGRTTAAGGVPALSIDVILDN